MMTRTLVRLQPVEVFFPPDIPASSLMAAFLIRVDDVRIASLRFGGILRDEDDTPDRTAFLFFLLRSVVIAVFDAAEVHKRLLAEPEFGLHLAHYPEHEAELYLATKRLSKAMTNVQHIRNQVAAHIDVRHLSSVLRLHAARQLGFVHLSNDPYRRRWGALQGILMAMMSKKPKTGLDKQALQPIVDHCNEAAGAVFELEAPTLLVFDKIVGGSLLSPK
jgi:hypothetical protein